MKINIYTSEEINKIREGGKITAMVIKKVLEKAVPGVTTKELDNFATELIVNAGGRPSFAMEKDYHWATCMNVNDMVVHGIPSDYKLQGNDILGMDVGTYYQGFHTDASWSKVISNVMLNSFQHLNKSLDEIPKQVRDDKNLRFLKTGERALEEAIKVCRVGNRIGHVSQKIQEIVEGGGYSCVKQLVGHGVGRDLHEDPEIPCFQRGNINNTAEIKEGMVLAIEIIYNEGKSPIVYSNDDGWTIVTRDGANSGLFEHTIAIIDGTAKIMTTP